MYRPFGLFDIPLVADLGKQGVLLDLEEKLLGPTPPLWSALAGLFSYPQSEVYTRILDESRDGVHYRGFLQGRVRAKGTEADVYFLAPALEQAVAPYIWQTLISSFCQAQGEKGVQRIFTKLPIDNEQALEIFREVGFGAYARRHIYCQTLGSSPTPTGGDNPWRPRHPKDTWGLMRLYSTVTPRPVQQAEGLERQKEGPPTPWFMRFAREEYVVESQEEIIAFLRLIPGRKAYWMKLILHPHAEAKGALLLSTALSLLPANARGAVYCGVREYEVALKGCISQAGFQPVAGEMLLVKHTTVRAEAPEPQTTPIVEKRVGRVTPAGMHKEGP